MGVRPPPLRPSLGQFGNCHGLVIDKDENIVLTYQGAGNDPHCLVKWHPDGTGGEFASKVREGDREREREERVISGPGYGRSLLELTLRLIYLTRTAPAASSPQR